LILWDVADQFIWATQVKRLKVGSAKHLSNVSRESLVKQLRKILAPDCMARAREIAPRLTKPSVGVAIAADLLEQTVRVAREASPTKAADLLEDNARLRRAASSVDAHG
jgi:UDP:flavonoid glycosyltransferase YjiC (YdhE family)